DSSEAKVTIRDVPDRPGVAASVFTRMAENNVNVDMIIQNISEAGTTDISFTVPETDLVRARRTADGVVAELGAREWVVDESIAKISLVGAGMKTHPGIAAQMFRALSDAGVNIDLISTSTIRVTCVVSGDDADTAVRALHASFGLSEDQLIIETVPGCGEGDER
ncbi:MAG: ACT domain-containing protein, partial [Coriobacteriia bacterium]